MRHYWLVLLLVFTASAAAGTTTYSNGGLFPDVVKTPRPAGPIPIPYPHSGFSQDKAKGSKKVKAEEPVVMPKQSFYRSEPHVIKPRPQGKTYYSSWNRDVKFEGSKMPRHLDINTHNH